MNFNPPRIFRIIGIRYTATSVARRWRRRWRRWRRRTRGRIASRSTELASRWALNRGVVNVLVVPAKFNKKLASLY
jgi:hypothetical protein